MGVPGLPPHPICLLLCSKTQPTWPGLGSVSPCRGQRVGGRFPVSGRGSHAGLTGPPCIGHPAWWGSRPGLSISSEWRNLAPRPPYPSQYQDTPRRRQAGPPWPTCPAQAAWTLPRQARRPSSGSMKGATATGLPLAPGAPCLACLSSAQGHPKHSGPSDVIPSQTSR